MKYLVASTGRELESRVDKRFGHPAYHLIVDAGTMESEAFPGPSAEEPSSGLNRFDTCDISGAISGNFGPGAFQALNSRGIKAYVCRGMTVREAVERVTSGEIEPASESTMKVSVRGGKGGGSGGGGRRGGGGRERGGG